MINQHCSAYSELYDKTAYWKVVGKRWESKRGIRVNITVHRWDKYRKRYVKHYRKPPPYLQNEIQHMRELLEGCEFI